MGLEHPLEMGLIGKSQLLGECRHPLALPQSGAGQIDTLIELPGMAMVEMIAEERRAQPPPTKKARRPRAKPQSQEG